MDSAAVNPTPTYRLLTPAVARGAGILLGLVLIASALLKAWDINVFVVQLARYGIVTLFFQTYAGLLAIGLELFLGVLLILGSRSALALGTTALMLLFYTGLIAYGWFGLGLDDCGCNGLVATPPPVGIVKNILLLALCFVAWKGTIGLAAAGVRGSRIVETTARTMAAAIVALGIAAYARTEVESVQPEVMGPRPFAAFQMHAGDQVLDLGKGEYFVALLSTTCKHCRDVVPPLNEMAKQPGFPQVVGLCKGNESLLQRFKDRAKPDFPLELIGFRDFYNLIGMAPPRFALVREGRTIAVWDISLPNLESVQEARTEPAALDSSASRPSTQRP